MTKIIFRPQRYTLDEAMAEAKEFNSVEEMKKYVVELHSVVKGPKFSIDDVVIDEDSVVNDGRNGWQDTMYVCVKRYGNKVYDVPQCIGMCATKYPPLVKVIYRPQRRTLEDSVAEAQEFNSIEALKYHIVKAAAGCREWFTTDDIMIDKASPINDEKIGWKDSMHVCVKRWGENTFDRPICLGFCATDYSVAI